jgi:GT2 family glycosyltransferase
MKAIIDVSIIIVNYNTWQLTKNCIESVINKTSGCTYEIIVVDNASSDCSKEKFETDKRIQYIYSIKNLGFGRANNIGAAHANGKYLFFLNSDTILVNNAVYILKCFLDSNPKAYIVGGQLVDVNLKKAHSYRLLSPGVLWELNILFFGCIEKIIYAIKHTCNKDFSVSYITGADLMIRRDNEKKIGLFEDHFFLYYEETDLCHRYKRYRFKSYFNHKAEIIHLEGASSCFSLKKLSIIYNSRNTYYQLHKPKMTHRICDFVFTITHYFRIVLFAFNPSKRRFWVNSLKVFKNIRFREINPQHQKPQSC